MRSFPQLAIPHSGRSSVRISFRLLLMCAATAALVGTQARGELVPASDTVAISLASITGADPTQCQLLIADLTGSDPSALLDGLTPGQAAELLELVAELTGLPITSTSMTTSMSDPPLLRD